MALPGSPHDSIPALPMSDTHRDRTAASPTTSAQVPSAIRHLVLALGCGAVLLGFMALQEPSRSQASPVAGITPASYAAEINAPSKGRLIGSVRRSDIHVEIFAHGGQTLFRTLCPAGEPMGGQMSAGQLTKRHPQLDITSLLAGAHATASPLSPENMSSPTNP